MHVISVIPLKRGIMIENLTYFSSVDYTAGTILNIPVRNSEILGLVTESKSVSKVKAALRAATFSLKKLPVQTDTKCLGTALVETARELSQYYAAPLGTVLYTLLPPEIRRGDIKVPHTRHPEHLESYRPQVLQDSKKDRYIRYKSLVRETFAHSGSVLLVVPTSIEALDIKKELEKGIEDRIILFSTISTKSEIKKSYKKLEDFSKAKLIIATPSYSLIERHDITIIIIEHARSAFYRTMRRPYLDYRNVLKIYAKKTGRRIMYGDILLRTEEEYLRREKLYDTYAETPKRIELQGKLEIIQIKKGLDTANTFTLFTQEAIEEIKKVKKKRGRIFLYAARRGLAPVVACLDCGFIFRSPQSGAPYSLLRTKENGIEKRWFVCSASGDKKPAADTCPECSSWRLRERGVGIQHVYDEVRKIFPSTPTILFDYISAKTYKKALFLRDTFYKSKGVIMLGTAMALPYLIEDVDLSIVVNMDALLATPTWRLEEENLALLLLLRESTKGKVLIQTRTEQTEILKHAKMGSVENFYTEELELRKKFGYPPYITFVHLTWQGSSEVVKKIENTLTKLLSDFNPSIYQHPTSPVETPIMYCLIRLPAEKWPNTKLVHVLRSIPPSVRLMINPDKII